jgi:hypothetical protein
VAFFPVALELVDERPPADTQDFRCFRAIEIVAAECLENGLSLDFAEALSITAFRCRGALRRVAHAVGQMLRQNQLTPR